MNRLLRIWKERRVIPASGMRQIAECPLVDIGPIEDDPIAPAVPIPTNIPPPAPVAAPVVAPAKVETPLALEVSYSDTPRAL